VETTKETLPLYTMNRNLLMSSVGTSRVSSRASSTRPPSPLSDDDSDDLPERAPGELGAGGDVDDLVAPLFSPDFHFPSSKYPNFMILETLFNIKAPANIKVPYPREEKKRKEWTETQRLHAGQAEVPKDISDFARMV